MGLQLPLGDGNHEPLTAAAVEGLIAAWLTENAEPRRRRFVELISHDEALLNWARQSAVGDSSEEVAHWFDAQGAAALLAAADACDPASLNEAEHRLLYLLRMQSRLDELQERFDATLHQEKLASMVALAAGAGHEINNPLGSIAGRAQLLLRDERDPERRRALAKINTQAFRAHEMIADMMLFAEPPAPKRKPVELVDIVDQVLGEFAEQLEDRSIEVEWRGKYEELEQAPTIEVDTAQIAVAISALVRNAVEAISDSGRISVSLRYEQQAESAWHTFTIRDDGPGIDAATRQHLFDPFYSGREAGRGLGFGLSKAWRVITAHNGQIEVESEPGHGAKFIMRLPDLPVEGAG